MTTPEDVLAFWLDETGPKGWYGGGAALDAEIRERFEPVWQAAMDGHLGMWLTYPTGVLAYIIVTDQFSRNMFRDTAAAYSSDRLARCAAQAALDQGFDLKIDPPARQFFYMPFEHSESQADQDHAVRLMKTRMDSEELLLHARAHREVIRRFGRFPYRNAHLGRATTPAEQVFLDAGGYRFALNEVKAA
ncbi:DUF924 family protein [Frigidibacter sp. ROC022]|uniref:DUF924 family protein n=1 Tax=Frigidibacter sp. ROC022 TaxID=2971796 RepID=UPI00215B5627|nr:DUF924 family protein [Frigidibacter sp. ROC022]MCR8723561.1 DUF924 domain-containing protein [Frigidibacter sp. ROC022]